MRIFFVHSIGKKKFGGGEKWLINAAKGLKDKGHYVYVGGRSGSKLIKAASNQGLETVELDILSDLSIYYVFKLAILIRKLKIEVFITKGRDLAIVGLASKISGNPLVIVRHGLQLRRSFRKHIFLLNHLADGIITNTKTIKEHYETKKWLPTDYTKVIYNGILLDNSSDQYNYSAIFPGKKIILSVGRLAAQKGFFHLIDAIALLKNKHNNLMFVILGEGKLHGRLQAYARKKNVSEMLHFGGFVENVIPYLKACEIFVLPSLYEGMPNAAMEAMSQGKPVVLTRVNGASELIPDSGKGLLIPPGDPQAIAKEVERLLKDNELCVKIGQEAKKHICDNFPVSSMISNIEAYLEEKLSVKIDKLKKKKEAFL